MPDPIKPAAPVAPAKSIINTMPDLPPRPTVSAAKALGLPESPSKTLDDQSKTMRKEMKLDAHLTTEPKKFIEPSKKKVAEPAVTPDPAPNATEPAKPAEPVAAKPDEEPAYVKELREEMKRLKEQAEQHNAPKAEPKVEPAAPKAPTKEELAAKEEERVQKRTAWMDNERKNLQYEQLSEKDTDTILNGGPEAVAKLNEIRSKDITLSTMRARETIFETLAPMIDQFEERMKNYETQLNPVYADHQQLQQMRVEEGFKQSHPDLVPHFKFCKSVAAELWQNFPEQMSKLSDKQVYAEVAKQSKRLLEQYGFNLAPAAPAADPAAPAAVTPPAPAAPAPAAPKAPVPPAPAAVTPSTAGSPQTRNRDKEIASTLI